MQCIIQDRHASIKYHLEYPRAQCGLEDLGHHLQIFHISSCSSMFEMISTLSLEKRMPRQY